jgi:hypothetical protein
MGQHLKIQPKPLKSGLGIGFWVQLQQDLNIAITTLEENSKADTSGSAASETAFDPDENTVTDLLTACTTVINTLKGD